MATQPPAPGPGWRPDASPSLPGPAAAPAPAEPAWRRYDGGPAGTPARVKLGRLAGFFALTLVTATALVWVVLWLAPPGPACLVLVGAGYEDNLAVPANPQGREAMARLARMAGSSSPLSRLFRRSGRLRLAGPPVQMERGTDWARDLDAATENTVIVFLALHGAADQQGAYLLPQDVTPAAEDRLRLQAVLGRLAKLPAKKHKLLLLDATGFESQWSLGIFHNNFARALDELEPRIAEIPNLVVVSASAADQSSWPAASYRLSLFGQHLTEGLAGAADADRDGRLDGWELFTHVRRRVEEDALRLRGVRQTPVLLPHADGEARARALSLTFRFESASDDTPATDPLPEISDAWRTYLTFLPRSGAGIACLPRDWQLWQAWLLRYETLRLAGSSQAGVALDQAQAAERRVLEGLRLGMASESATLAMPGVTGHTQLEVPNPYPPLERVWQAAPADRQTLIGRLEKSEGPLLRRNLLVALVRRAAENPARNLAQAADVARRLDDPLNRVRPAEAHFLVSLSNDLPTRNLPDEIAAAVSLALRVRLLAEETALAVTGNGYTYAERLRPRIASLVEKADRERRLGQDLLFASRPEQWREAADRLTEAKSLYEQAGELTRPWREALAACDRARAELPVHCVWIAPLADDPDDTWVSRAVGLFERVRELEVLVNTPGLADRAKTVKVEALTKEVRSGLAALRDRLDGIRRTCESGGADSVNRAERVLRVPWLTAEQRLPLLRKLRRLEQMARSARVENLNRAPDSGDDQTARRLAVRQGRLAMAALGPSRFDALAPDRDSFNEVMPHVRRPSFNGGWPKALAWAGEQVAVRRQRVSRRINELLATARAKPAAADTPLDESDQLVRLLDAGECQALPADPVPVARRHRLGALLVWQANRTWRDHWYADDPEAEPYYRAAGKDFLRDAKATDTLSPAGPVRLAQTRELLDAPDGIRIDPGNLPRHLVAGENLLLTARLHTEPGTAVEGTPVYWTALGDKLAFARTAEQGRIPLPLKDGKPVDPPAVTIGSPDLDMAERFPPADAAPERTQLNWHVYYRGQKPSAASPVFLHPVPESTRVEHARPPRAAIAVRADGELIAREGEGVGGIAIVFDASGSIGPGEGQPATSSRRFRQAVAALRKILARIPRGVRVSLWTFGQAVPPRNTVEKAEETIQQAQAPAVWEGGESAADALVRQVEALTPWNLSPVTRAILRAREDLARVEGGRMLIVLSDGDDNRFATDAAGNPAGEAIGDAVRKAFARSNTSIHLVGFAGADGLAKNYGFVTEMRPPGTLSTVDQLAPVLETLDQTFKRTLRYRLSGGLGEFRSPLVEVSRPGENDRWLQADGRRDGYRLELERLGLERRVTLDDGDAVIVGLGPDRSLVRRLLWSREPALALRPAAERGGWRVAAVQNQLFGERALQMLLAAEKIPDEGDGVGQVHPGETWLEVRPTLPRDDTRRPAVRWGSLPGYPAPVWGVDAAAWPAAAGGPARPQVRMWWSETRKPGSTLLRRESDFGSFAELRGEWKVGGDRVELMPAVVEEHWVQVAADRREKRLCLVIRARHAAGNSAWVRLEGVPGLAGEEHRHFLEAGRYLGLFWFATGNDAREVRDRFERSVQTVRLFSAGAFKQECEAREQNADFTDLDTPAATPPRPAEAVR